MQTVLLMLGTLVIQGGLVFLLMWLITAGDREEELQRRLAAPEAEEQRLRKVG